MRKFQITLLIVLSSIFCTNGAIAQNKPLACQGEAAAGFNWVNGRWNTSLFETNKFILVQAGKTLTTESVAKAMDSSPITVTCKDDRPLISCLDKMGTFLLFNPLALKGTIARTLGGVVPRDKKDSVVVEVFSCTPF